MRRLTTILVALTMVVAACGDDDDTDTAVPVEEDTTSAPADDDTSAPADGDDRTVTIVDFSFDPATIEVGAGTTVAWTNEDGVGHTVTAGTPDAAEGTFDERVDGGQTAEVAFEEAGTFDYFCAIHPTMTGQVVVS